MLITTSSDLADFCAALQGAPYVAVDTEFMREKRYFAHLCLVQVAHGDHAAAIDPLVDGLDLQPLYDLLCDPGIVKVLHSATQDLEIFLDKTGQVPTPVFDTQIAATVCGLGEQPGYAKLVEALLGVRIDKTSQATDWSLRPLSKRQLTYALGDVTHLCKVYEILAARLAETGRADWVAEDMAALQDPARYRPDPAEAWRRIRIRRPSAKTLAVLRELAAWREQMAMKRNIPRGWVARNEVLVEIAQSQPRDVKALSRVRGLKGQAARGRDGAAMLSAVERALGSPKSSWPEVVRSPKRSDANEALVALLHALLRHRSQLHDVAPSVVASRRELDLLATEASPDVPALHGWRREIFGADALELVAGRLALTGGDGSVVERR